jgi:hypothetical protein
MTTATATRAKAQATRAAQAVKIAEAEATENETVEASLAQRLARWTNDYRNACEATENARTLRDTAIVNVFRALPDTETVTKHNTKTGTKTVSTKAVSDNARALETLRTVAVGVDEKGKTNDIFGLTPQRVVQIVKSYRRMDLIVATSTKTGQVAPELESEAATALSAALLEAAKSNALGDKGTDALAETLAKSAPENVNGAVLEDATSQVRDAIAKAKDASKAKADKGTDKTSEAPKPVVALSDGIAALWSDLESLAQDLDPQQKALMLGKFRDLADHAAKHLG